MYDVGHRAVHGVSGGWENKMLYLLLFHPLSRCAQYLKCLENDPVQMLLRMKWMKRLLVLLLWKFRDREMSAARLRFLLVVEY